MNDGGLLERADHRAALAGLVSQADAGCGSAVLISGPAGIGKTSLLRAAREAAIDRGMRVLSAVSSVLEIDFAFGVVRQLFDPVVYRGDPAHEDIFSGAAAQAQPIFNLTELRPSVDPSDASFSLLHGLFWMAANLSSVQPVAVIIDDMQWCDGPSLRFVVHLLRRLENLPIAVIMALRTGEPAPQPALLREITELPVVDVRQVAPLSLQSSTQLVRRIFPEADDDLCRKCYSAAGGVPFFTEQIALGAAHGARLPRGRGQGAEAPRAIRRRISDQLDRLGHPSLALAQAVAVLERAMLRLAAELAGLAQEVAGEAAERLAEAGILDVDGALHFRHPIVRAAVYDAMSSVRRQHLHAAAAQLLMAGDADVESVAAHLLLTRPGKDESVPAVLGRAATRASQRGSPEAAIRYLERALLEAVPADIRRDVTTELARVTVQVEPAKAVDQLRGLLSTTVAPLERAQVADRLCAALIAAGQDLDEVIPLAETALHEWAGDDADVRQRLLVRAGLIEMMFPALRYPLDKRVAHMRSERPTEGVGGELLHHFLSMYASKLELDRPTAVREAEAALRPTRISRGPNNDNFALSAYLTLAAADLGKATPILDVALASARRYGSPASVAKAQLPRGAAWYWRGELAEAESDLRSANADITSYVYLQYRSFLAYVLVEQGRLDEAHDVLETIWPSTHLPDRGMYQYYLWGRGQLHLARRQWLAAIATLKAAGENSAGYHSHNPAFIPWRSDAALALQALKRRDEAAELAKAELALARRWGEPRCLGRALRAAAMVADSGLRESLLSESVTVLAGSHARLEHAKSLLALGRQLRQLGRAKKASTMLLQAMTIAHQCGARPVVENARAELHSLGLRPRRNVVVGVDALTPSERQVADLVIAGLSNRDIAQRLYVTQKTVETHLTSVYRKLQVAGRNELAKSLRSA